MRTVLSAVPMAISLPSTLYSASKVPLWYVVGISKDEATNGENGSFMSRIVRTPSELIVARFLLSGLSAIPPTSSSIRVSCRSACTVDGLIETRFGDGVAVLVGNGVRVGVCVLVGDWVGGAVALGVDEGAGIVEGLMVGDGAEGVSRVMVTVGANTKSTGVRSRSAGVQPTNKNAIAPITRRRVVLTSVILRPALRQHICIK